MESARPPFVETQVEYIQVNKLRLMTKRELLRLQRAMVVIVEGQPVAVVVPMPVYTMLQQLAIGFMGPTLDAMEACGALRVAVEEVKP